MSTDMTVDNAFHSLLNRELLSSLARNYRDNYDYHLFGKLSLRQRTKELVKSVLFRYGFSTVNTETVWKFVNDRQMEKFEYLYAALNDSVSKELLVKLVLYRLLGHNKVRLLEKAMQLMDQSYTYADLNDRLPLDFMNWQLINYDLAKIGYPIRLYSMPKTVIEQFILRQYAYQTPKVSVKPEDDDIILDCGACFGETALFLAHESAPHGKVYSFEFIRGNIEIFKRNISLNSELVKRVTLIQQPVWAESECHLFYRDNGPASKVGFEKFAGAHDQTVTISIDDAVARHRLPRVDFIKMDIEGAELSALNGAVRTLKQYKPKLAIAVYHNLDHFKSIPEFLKTILPGYQLYLGHYSIHTDETVLYAIHGSDA